MKEVLTIGVPAPDAAGLEEGEPLGDALGEGDEGLADVEVTGGAEELTDADEDGGALVDAFSLETPSWATQPESTANEINETTNRPDVVFR